MNIKLRNIANAVLPPALALVLAILGARQAGATEITGTLSLGVGTQSGGTNSDGSIGGTVIGGVNPSSSGGSSSGSSGGVVAARSGGNSRSSGGSASTLSSGIQSDGTLASVSEFTGTGGGYDPSLDTYLASPDAGPDDASLSASDAIAYNSAQQAVSSLSQTDNTAAAANSGRTMGIVMAILLGLAVAGLGGYAVSAYMAYRREGGDM
ncbi:MAG TPA: hypothetical protein VHE10_03730 [Candidatus Paceibacterota bacterium]|nr:hypothetical protein [Candidatus Paceibacterota bacterium]